MKENEELQTEFALTAANFVASQRKGNSLSRFLSVTTKEESTTVAICQSVV
jgi:hypothetical protein